MDDNKIKARWNDLSTLEMKFNMTERSFYGMHDYNKDFNVAFVEIQCETDDKWNEIINGLREELTKRKQQL